LRFVTAVKVTMFFWIVTPCDLKMEAVFPFETLPSTHRPHGVTTQNIIDG
jgi:hypothetical protein